MTGVYCHEQWLIFSGTRTPPAEETLAATERRSCFRACAESLPFGIVVGWGSKEWIYFNINRKRKRKEVQTLFPTIGLFWFVVCIFIVYIYTRFKRLLNSRLLL